MAKLKYSDDPADSQAAEDEWDAAVARMLVPQWLQQLKPLTGYFPVPPYENRYQAGPPYRPFAPAGDLFSGGIDSAALSPPTRPKLPLTWSMNQPPHNRNLMQGPTGSIVRSALEDPTLEAAEAVERWRPGPKPIPSPLPAGPGPFADPSMTGFGTDPALTQGQLPGQSMFPQVIPGLLPEQQIGGQAGAAAATAPGLPSGFERQQQVRIEPGQYGAPGSMGGTGGPQGANPMWGLLAAGLGILANNTGHYGQAGPAIGKGGLIGLQTHLAETERVRDENFRRDTLAQQGLYQQAQMRHYDALSRTATSKEAREFAAEQRDAAFLARYKAASPAEREAILQEWAINKDPVDVYKADAAARAAKDKDKDSALQQKRAALIRSGVSEALADAIVGGRFLESRHPVTGEALILDLGQGATKRELPKPVPPPPTAIDPNLNAAQGTGVSGWMGNIANRVSDILGMELPYPDVDKAANALETLRIKTITQLQDAFPGRPSNELLRRLDPMTVVPKSLLQGDEGAYLKLQQTRDFVRTEVERLKNDTTAEIRPDELSRKRMAISQLDGLLAEYDAIIGRFETRRKAATRKTPEQLLEEIQGSAP